MPLPLLHSFAGYAVYKVFESFPRDATGDSSTDFPSYSQKTENPELSGIRGLFLRFSRHRLLFACILLANFPDFDFIPGIFLERAALFHRGISHSVLGGAVIACFTAYIFWGLAGRNFTAAQSSRFTFRRLFLLFFLAYMTHPALDVLNLSSRGVMIFWPFYREPLFSPFVLLGGKLDHSPLELAGGIKEFIAAVVANGFYGTIFFELSVIFCFVGVWALLDESKRRICWKDSMAVVRFAQALIFMLGFIVTAGCR